MKITLPFSTYRYHIPCSFYSPWTTVPFPRSDGVLLDRLLLSGEPGKNQLFFWFPWEPFFQFLNLLLNPAPAGSKLSSGVGTDTEPSHCETPNIVLSVYDEISEGLSQARGTYCTKQWVFSILTSHLPLLCPAWQPVGSGLDVFGGRPKLSAWRDRVQAAIGKELFDDAHQTVMGAKENVTLLDESKAQLYKAKFLRLFMWSAEHWCCLKHLL